MSGWIKLHRSILESETYNLLSMHQKLIMIEILLRANYTDKFWFDKKTGKKVQIKTGQVITSVNKIKNEWFKNEKLISDKKIRNSLEKLQKLDFLAIETTNSYTLLTVCKYSDYQGDENEKGEQKGVQGASEGQTKGKRRASKGQQLKKVKKEKNISNTRTNKFDEVHMQLANLFVNEIKKNIADFKSPDTESWANTIRLMMEKDHRTKEQIEYLIKWVQQDDFEMANVLSPVKLRKRFDNLVLKAKQDYVKNNNSKKTGRQEQNQSLLERMKQGESNRIN
ncbi:hypothetical protein [Listeria seeligeri]|uniref:hypothetical protein n=1 Tax=Listeria seeligeri TaxID=1640 RepID=UPI0022EB3415|nr:hypothetical protein [Listeria seeligeri]